MARGTRRTEEASAARERQREEWAKDNFPRLTKNMLPAVVRFLEQGDDINEIAQHEYSEPNPQNPGQPFKRRFTCFNDKLDGTPCPGCNSGLKMKFRGVFNVIQRQRGIIRRGSDGKAIKGPDNKYIIDGFKDEVVVLDVPSTCLETLRKNDVDWKGLMTGEIKVEVNTSTFEPFRFTCADFSNWFNQPMTDVDIQLAQGRHNIDEVMRPPSFDDASQIVAREVARLNMAGGSNAPAPVNSDSATAPSQGQPAAGQSNVFA